MTYLKQEKERKTHSCVESQTWFSSLRAKENGGGGECRKKVWKKVWEKWGKLRLWWEERGKKFMLKRVCLVRSVRLYNKVERRLFFSYLFDRKESESVHEREASSSSAKKKTSVDGTVRMKMVVSCFEFVCITV